MKKETSLLWPGVLGSSNVDQEAMNIYERHNRYIIETTPPEKLLIWGPQDGWEPLCKFLDLPIPDEPVPHINEVSIHSFSLLPLRLYNKCSTVSFSVSKKSVIRRNVKKLIKQEMKTSLTRIILVIFMLFQLYRIVLPVMLVGRWQRLRYNFEAAVS